MSWETKALRAMAAWTEAADACTRDLVLSGAADADEGNRVVVVGVQTCSALEHMAPTLASPAQYASVLQ